jgi:H+/Cl- antiporter ClcA
MPDDKDEISQRIEELGQKSSQILLFLSFAMVSVATLKTVSGASSAALDGALLWWKWALLPVLIGVLPMKEFGWKTQAWVSGHPVDQICSALAGRGFDSWRSS